MLKRLVAATLLSCSLQVCAQERAQTNLRFIDSLGINTHFGYIDTYKDPLFLGAEVEKLGVKHVRDGTSLVAQTLTGTPNVYQAMLHMGSTGVRYAAGYASQTTTPGVFSYSTSLFQAGIAAMAGNGTSYIDSLEGVNEVDINDQNWIGNWPTNQNNLIAADTMNLPILSVSLAFSYNFPGKVPVQSPNPNKTIYGNIHSYAGNAMPGVLWPAQFNQIRSSFPEPFQIVATESGYHNDTANGNTGSVDEATSAKYIPRTYLENFRAGVYRTYMYELFDEVSDWNTFLQEPNGPHTCTECSFGMIRADGTEKPAFTAVKNLITVLKNGATSAVPGTLVYSITGGDSTLHHVLLQKAAGTFDLILWQEVPSFDTATNLPKTVAPMPVTLSVNALSVKTYRPSESTSSTLKAVLGYNVALNVPDDVLVVEIATAPVLPQFGGNTTLGLY